MSESTSPKSRLLELSKEVLYDTLFREQGRLWNPKYLVSSPVESCGKCGTQSQPHELFCPKCGEKGSILREIGDISLIDVVSSDFDEDVAFGTKHSKGLRVRVSEGSRANATDDEIRTFDKGFLSIMRKGIIFLCLDEKHVLAKQAAARAASAIIPFGGLLVGAVANALQGPKEDQLAKVLSHPSTFIIPYSAISSLTYYERGSSFTGSKKCFTVLTERSGADTRSYTIVGDGTNVDESLNADMGIRSVLIGWVRNLIRTYLERRLATMVNSETLCPELEKAAKERERAFIFKSKAKKKMKELIDNALRSSGSSLDSLENETEQKFAALYRHQKVLAWGKP